VKGRERDKFHPAEKLQAFPAPSCPGFHQNSAQNSDLSMAGVHYFVHRGLNTNLTFCVQTPRTTSLLLGKAHHCRVNGGAKWLSFQL